VILDQVLHINPTDYSDNCYNCYYKSHQFQLNKLVRIMESKICLRFGQGILQGVCPLRCIKNVVTLHNFENSATLNFYFMNMKFVITNRSAFLNNQLDSLSLCKVFL
jgi:hypothetical protein